MKIDHRNHSNRILAYAMAIVLFISILFCYQYMIQNAHHNCIGEECPVCMELHMAAQTLSGLKLLPILPVVLAVLCVFTLAYTSNKEILRAQETLITLKVELLD